MAQAKYFYNPETCQYEKLKTSKQTMLLRLLGHAISALLLAAGFSLTYTQYFDSPKEALLKQENKRLREHYTTIQNEVAHSHQLLVQLQKQDDQVYRLVLGTEPVPTSIRQAGAGGVDPHAALAKKAPLIATTAKKVEQLTRELRVQAKSYEEIAKLAKEKQKRLAALPAISPLSGEKPFYMSSGFGMRKHPVYGASKMHTGVDLAARRGTPIYATAHGVVKLAMQSKSGYGIQVVIDHGYGFATRYAHMQSFKVKPGQRVARGECIGYVGNTGTSTSPHLHYEVLKNRKPVNPVNYFFNDLDPMQYREIVELAARSHQTLS